MDNESSKNCNLGGLFVPSAPQCRKSIRSDVAQQVCHSNNNYTDSSIEYEMIDENEASSIDESVNYDTQIAENSTKYDKDTQFPDSSQNRSRTISPERTDTSLKKKTQLKKNYQPLLSKQAESANDSTDPQKEEPTNLNKTYLFLYSVCIFIIAFIIGILIVSSKISQSTNNARPVLFKAIEDVKIRFHNQEFDIWNDISSGINEVVSSSPKIPSIILLFGNETATMDCLAKALADASSTILGTDGPLNLNPEDFGDDPGEIITSLNKRIPTSKAVIIRNILNINAEAIKALHNLCDRINPLVGEAIYIITMPTKNYTSSEKKLAFVENQIHRKLSQNIKEDILRALITRITDGAIISVRPEPNLRYC